MIEIRQLSLRFGAQVVFDSVSADINRRDRIGLAGRNGAGKTTLLRLLTGAEQPDGGRINLGKGMSIGYLPQDGIEWRGRSLIEEVESAEGDIEDLHQRLEAAHQRVADRQADASSAEAWETIHWIEGELQRREAHKLRARAGKVLSGLGFHERDFPRDTGEFSGGWQMRIALARLLLQQPDYLLLDEPTNHLDLPSQRWLENTLQNYPGGLVIISHDRAFLDQLTHSTWYLSRGKLEIYAGNYSFYETESALRRETLLARKTAQDRQLVKTQRFIDRFRSKASKATQVQSRIKQLEKVNRIEIESEEATFSFQFPPAPRGGQTLVELQTLHKAFGPLQLFRGFSLKIERGQRLAVVGVNGAGKSTLARILAGEESLDAGQRMVGAQTRIAYFAQHQTEQLDPAHTALESVLQATGSTEQQARNILGTFLFTGDDVFKPVGVLSGGEKNRLALARILLQPANMLILDEPTNHLDMPGKQMLQKALRDYDGACFLISHDRDFLDPLVQQTLEISPGGHRMFWCNVSAYLEQVESREGSSVSDDPAAVRKAADDRGQNPKLLRRLKAERLKRLRPLRLRVEQCEGKVAEIDREVEDWEKMMKDPSFFSSRPGRNEDLKAYDDAKRRQARALEAWENAQSALEAAEREERD